jgi:CYTH domain-containing protein
MRNPVILSILYRSNGDYHVTLRVRGSNNDANLTLTVIHENVLGVACAQTITGNGESRDIIVQDCESLTILARRESVVVACSVFEVSTDLMETVGLILSPVSIAHMDVDQCDMAMMEASMQRNLYVLSEALEVQVL